MADLRARLDESPEAIVAAIDETGLFVPLPPALELSGQRVSPARSALDLVTPVDQGAVIRAWQEVRSVGSSRAVVALNNQDQGRADLHFFDVRAALGVFFMVLVPAEATGDLFERVAEMVGPAPRIARTRKNEMAVILDVDEDFTRLLGWPREDFVGRESREFIHPDDQDRAVAAWMEALSRPGATSRVKLRHRHLDGRWIWMEFANRNLLDRPQGCVECEMVDISQEMEAQEAVRASEQLLRRLAETLPVGVAQLDVQRRLVYANGFLRGIFGVDVDATAEDMARGVAQPEDLARAIERVFTGRDVDVELRIDPIDGSGRRLCRLSLRALTSADGSVSGAVACLADVTEASRLQAELEQRATYDALTGCLNRAATMAALESTLSAWGWRTAVIFLDLDGFKAVNDQYGHAVGDTLLVAVAGRLHDAVRTGDVVGRIGGDEFLIVCPDVEDAATAAAVAERVSDVIPEVIPVDGRHLRPRASIGVAWAGGSPTPVDAESLIVAADAAMYGSKSAGQGRPVTSCRPDWAERDAGVP